VRIVRPDLRERALAALPRWIAEQVPRDHQESDAAFRKRRKVVAATSLTGAGLLGAGLSTKPGSPQFYGLTAATAATWVVGGLTSGRLHLGHIPRRDELARPVVTPVLVGAGAFGVFYAAALVARHIPLLNRAIGSVLEYSYQGSDRLVLVTTLANGAAEEVFFRGALYAAVGRKHPVATSTGVYALATVATRNPALVLASVVMGALFGLQRRASGGIQAPILTHLTWSVLMLRFLPPLFRRQRPIAAVGRA
jgi:membrane protease YdiL (CAAX protease family)